jgi:hypothetical protein
MSFLVQDFFNAWILIPYRIESTILDFNINLLAEKVIAVPVE